MLAKERVSCYTVRVMFPRNRRRILPERFGIAMNKNTNTHAKKKKTAAHSTAAQRPSKKGRKPAPAKKMKGLMIALSSVMGVFALLVLTAAVYLYIMFDRVQFEGETSEPFVSYVDDNPAGSDFSGDVLDDPYEHAQSVADIPVRGNEQYITNILLMGIDNDGNGGYAGRSDTNIILSIDKRNKTIKMVSILRDTWVTIPGRDYDHDGKDDYQKFNAAHSGGGGFELVAKTIQQNFRLKIDQYIKVNFDSFEYAVDAIGGIDIELTKAETTQICTADQRKESHFSGFKRIGTEAGVYHLNGYQALQYSRIRKLDSDFGRTERQRKMVSALIGKAKTMGIWELNSLLYNVLPHVSTNMSANELAGYVMNMLEYVKYDIEADYHVPMSGEYRDVSIRGGAGLWLENPKQVVSNLHQYLYG